MTDKAYIVANEQQEREVLEKLEREGFTWFDGYKPTEFIPLKLRVIGTLFPYALLDKGHISWAFLSQLKDEEIIYDGRKEERMSDKYVVSQEFMNELKEWNKDRYLGTNWDVTQNELSELPVIVQSWQTWSNNLLERNNRLIAILRWVDGEDVFKVEKPKKWVVRSKDSNDVGEHRYLRVTYTFSINHAEAVSDVYATKFDTKEEAESWANAHQEVVQVEVEEQ